MRNKQRVVIERATWRRRTEPHDWCAYGTLLRNGDGSRCCLGFIGEAIGCPTEYTERYATYTTTYTNTWQAPDWLKGRQKQAIDINDSEGDICSLDYQKEAALQRLFADTPIELVFVDKVEP